MLCETLQTKKNIQIRNVLKTIDVVKKVFHLKKKTLELIGT